MSQNKISHSIKSEIRNTMALSIPLVTSQLIYACSGFIGTAMIARLGEDALAASVLVSTIWMSLSVLFFGLLNSVSVLVSLHYGAEDNRSISEVMGQSFLLGTLVTVLIVMLLYGTAILLRYTISNVAVLELAHDYMLALVWTTPGLVLLIIYEQFLAGINRAKIVLRISLLVVPIEIPIIYVLIFGKLGFPAFGVAGIGYGFAITYTITAIILTIYFLRSHFYHRFGLFKNINKIKIYYLKELIKIGVPMGFMHVIEVSTFTIASFWIAKFGTTMLAAHQIVMQYLGFVITLVFAMSQAVTVRVGHSVGKLDLLGIRYATYVGMVLNFVCMLVIAIAFYCLPKFFLSLDIDVSVPANLSLMNDASVLLSICGILMLFDNFRIIGFGALRGLKDTVFPMYVSLVSFWIVGLSAAYLFGFTWQFQGIGIWWGLTLGIAVGALILFLRLQWLLKNVDLTKII